jgi:hypothetical protein
MKVFVINLPARTERLEQFTNQAKEQGFKFEVQCGEEFKHDRKKGITRSHQACVRKAKEAGEPMVAIFEDDTLFLGKGAWDYFLSTIPEKFHLYFTMFYSGSMTEENKINAKCSGMTGYIIHESFYDAFLAIPESSHIDRESTGLFKDYDFYVCPQFVCEQDGSFSDNIRKAVGSYRTLLRGKKLYGE